MNGTDIMNSHSYVVFDLETTGLSTETDEVIEISAIKVINGVISDEFSTLVNPGMIIPYTASEVTGITDAMVADAPRMEVVLKDFVSFIGDMVLVGHNIKRFDMKFIKRDCIRYLGKEPENKVIDTLFLSRILLPELDHYSLQDLAHHYGISYDGAHRALADCRINQQVYQCLLEETENLPEAPKDIQICPKCGNVLRKRSGRFGEFWGCGSYPDCKYTRNI